MHVSLRVETAPTAEPVDIDLAKRHCRLDNDSDDEILLPAYIAAARAAAEQFLGRSLITQTLISTWRHSAGETRHAAGWFWPAEGGASPAVELPRAPVQSLTSVTVLDSAGARTDVTAQCSCDTGLEPARLRLDWGTIRGLSEIAFPAQHIEAVFVAGYGKDGNAVPAPIVNAILIHVAYLYERRGDDGGDIPPAIEALLWPYRIPFLGG
jgi:uncharacterized phiE125 gp8 family phage protein